MPRLFSGITEMVFSFKYQLIWKLLFMDPPDPNLPPMRFAPRKLYRLLSSPAIQEIVYYE